MTTPVKTPLPLNSSRSLQLTAGGSIEIEAAADGSTSSLPRFQMIAYTGTEEAVKSSVGIFTTVIFAATIALFLAGGVVSVVIFVKPQRRRYAKFVSHHKAHAGGQARLLKMMMQKEHHVFLDSDNLIDLDGLFELIRTDVDNMVVFLTRDT